MADRDEEEGRSWLWVRRRKKKKKAKPAFFSLENIRSLALLVLIVFAVRWSVVSPYHVPTPSMEPTIKVGDRLLAYKLAYNLKIPFTDIVVASWGEPRRGDIIVFRYPIDPDIDYVKRVVAIAGDRVAVRDGYLFINGVKHHRSDHNFDRQVLDDIYDDKDEKLLYREKIPNSTDEDETREFWVMHNRFPRPHGDHWPQGGASYRVPEDSVFVMGDNRHNSTDSREWKEVPMSYVKGKALIVIWSVYTPLDSPWYDIRFRFRRFGTLLN